MLGYNFNTTDTKFPGLNNFAEGALAICGERRNGEYYSTSSTE